MEKEREKQRVIQEYVPGKQVTLAHIIANPDSELYRKLGLSAEAKDAIGIMTITPSEASIIAADLAIKAAGIQIGFVDRFRGSLVFSGVIASVESAINEGLEGLRLILGFSAPPITRT